MLFDESPEQVAPLVRAFVETQGSLLHSTPRVVEVSDRSKECRECGFLAGRDGQPAHLCPWPHTAALAQQRSSERQRRSKEAQVAAQAAAGGAGPAVGRDGKQHASVSAAGTGKAQQPASERICSSWRKTKSCLRLGVAPNPCRLKHPADYVVPVKHCFDFAKGSCTRSVCAFPHFSLAQLAGESGAAPAPSAESSLAASLPPAASAPPSASPAAAVASAPPDPSLGSAPVAPALPPAVPAASAAAAPSQPPAASSVAGAAEPGWKVAGSKKKAGKKRAADSVATDAAPAAPTSTVRVQANWAKEMDEEDDRQQADDAMGVGVSSSAAAAQAPQTPPLRSSSLASLSSPTKAQPPAAPSPAKRRKEAGAAPAAGAASPERSGSRTRAPSRPACNTGSGAGGKAGSASSSPARHGGGNASHQ